MEDTPPISRNSSGICWTSWHQKCEIILDYIPPFPDANRQPEVQVRYNNGTEYMPYLRYSKGPNQCFFWDVYGEPMQDLALAIIALSKAPAPVSVSPVTYHFELKGGKE